MYGKLQTGSEEWGIPTLYYYLSYNKQEVIKKNGFQD